MQEGDQQTKESWFSGFGKTFLMILSMEIGDKTFFICAILSTSHNKVAVFIGSVLALVAMCVISCAIGVAAPMLISKSVTTIIAFCLVCDFSVF